MLRGTRNRATAVFAATLLLSATMVLAQPGGRGDGAHRHGPGYGAGSEWGERGGPRGILGRMAERLDLSDGQKEEIRGLFESHREETEGLRQELRALEGLAEEAIHADPFDEEAVRAAARRVADVRVEMAVARARLGDEIRNILTPEQREQAAELRERRQELRGEFGRGPGGRGFRGRPGPGGGRGVWR